MQEAGQVLDKAQRLGSEGRWREAVQLLTDANRRARDPEMETRLVDTRHRGFTHPEGETARAASWPPPVGDEFEAGAGLPEVKASDLDAATLASALRHHGSLIVRGLIPATVAATLADDIDEAFDAAKAFHHGASVADTAPSYVPFEPVVGYEFGAIERQFWRFGAVLAVEAPHAFFDLVEALHAAGLGELFAEYFGEWPALSGKKTSLRRANADTQSEWHQDGAFLGEHTRSVNVWIAITPCGDDAPSIDVVARPFDHLVPTGTDDAHYAWSVSRAEVARLPALRVVRPEFEPGDALLFNQMTLHRTAVSPAMTKERLAIESWFFAPSTFPLEQVPISF
jgi:hypothetical protein